ncbi:MAG TPA: hypothetical protein VNC61_15850 [Acidimicrobiales bacterium]|nr:hypothetical protein [Acidimicrobiales bacterium]
MTMESRQPEGAGSNSDLVRSAALSSADLWHEVLERLNEVQEGQIRLARAIESLGMIVCDALSVNPQAALTGAEQTAPLPRAQQRVPLAAGPPPADIKQQVAPSERELAATQRTIDSLLSSDVFVPAAPGPESRQSAGTPSPAVAATGSATSPRFYVAPVPEENRNVTREPVSTGAWPRGRRVARGLAREGPSLTGPAVVPNLTPAAIDALLAAEFGDPSMAPAPRPQMVPAAQAGPLLNALLGTQFQATASVPVPPAARPATPPVGSPPVAAVAPSVQTAAPAPPPPPMAFPPTPASSKPAPSKPAPSVPAPSMRPPVVPSSPPAAATPGNAPWAPTVDPRRPAPPASPGSTLPGAAPFAPLRNPAAGPGPVLGPSGPASIQPPSAAAPSAAPRPRLSGGPGVAGMNMPNDLGSPAGGPEGAILHRSPLDAVSGNPAPFGAPTPPPDGTTATMTPDFGDPGGSLPQPPLEPEAPAAKRADSAAMATEILALAPNASVVEPTESAPTMLAEDVTIMAKGRRRRFRLR